jgi:hypothetical protein
MCSPPPFRSGSCVSDHGHGMNGHSPYLVALLAIVLALLALSINRVFAEQRDKRDRTGKPKRKWRN